MNEETLIRRKILDSATKAYHQNIYTYTGFLGINELSIYHSMTNDLSFISSCCFGGTEASERQMIQFGSKKELGYSEEFPIDIIKISPLSPKFAESLGHRDYLGALMNTGIERSLLGDIIIKNTNAYLFCARHISDFIEKNISTIKHTNVVCTNITNSIDTSDIDGIKPELKELELIAASPRIDAVVASITKRSRSNAAELFNAKKIYINGICNENKSYQLKSGDIVVIRGTGKFIYLGCGNETRKGRIYVHLKQYV
ncbi:MAG: hypothetical protein HFJ03_12795 [Lachnospira sp.]|jgi:RNA-binding protein YlmH|nr:hypothetical protein [Lachnospira sp.]